MRWLMAVMLCALVPALAQAQDVTRSAPQQASEPNYGTGRDQGTGPAGQEIRPGSAEGDAPSASAGRPAPGPGRRRNPRLPGAPPLPVAPPFLRPLPPPRPLVPPPPPPPPPPGAAP